MDYLLYASAMIAALSLLLIAIFVVITLKSAKKTMTEVSDTLKRVETKLGGITEKSEMLMNKTNQIAEDAESKLQTFNSLTASAKNLGESTNYMNNSIRSISDQVSNPPEKYTELMQKATVLTETAARIYFKFVNEKERNNYRTTEFLPNETKKTNY